MTGRKPTTVEMAEWIELAVALSDTLAEMRGRGAAVPRRTRRPEQ